MTLTRPVYEATIENVTAGWSYTLTAGDVPDPADGMWVIDPLNVTWGFSNGLVPGQLDADEASFSIRATLAADLPELNLGDIVLINIDRPTAGSPIPYVHFAGRVTDASLLQVPNLAVTLTVSCSDFLAELASTVVPGGAFVAAEDLDQRVLTIAARTGVNMITSSRLAELNGGTNVDPAAPAGAVAAEMLVKLIQVGTDVWILIPPGGLSDTHTLRGVYVLRAWYDPTLPTTADAEIGINNPSPIYYLIQPSYKAAPTDALPFELTRTAGVTSATPTSDAEENSHIIVLSARKVPVGPSRRKTRDAAINQVSYTFYPGGGAANMTVQLDDVLEDLGPNPREIEVSTQNVGIPTDDTNPYLPDEPSTRAWSFPDMSIPILDETFDDAQLDNYAPLFYPTPTPAGLDHDPKLGRPVVLFDISPDVDVDGLAATGVLAGCQFSIAGGLLTLVPQVSARNPTLIDMGELDSNFEVELGITWADIAADVAIEPTTWATLDPDLTWDDFRLIEN